MGGVLWMFRSYRELALENQALRRDVSDLQRALTEAYRDRGRPALENDLMAFRDEVLQEVPFSDNKVPDNFWLTPEVQVAAPDEP